VLRTPFFLNWRYYADYAVAGIEETKLVVFEPNWLLDPRRAEFGHTGPPKTPRLCWRVVFGLCETLRPRADPNVRVPLPPAKVAVFLDAATGECVGALFN
jgi:hypothetical protein